VSVPGTLDLYMLNLSSGAVQPELVYTDRNLGFEARTWLDNTRVYVVGVPNNTPVPLESLYILDTKKGANQHPNDLLQVIQPRQPQYCWDFDSDYNTTRLITSSCTVSFPVGSTDRGIQQGPGNISVQPITGGQGNTVYTSAQLAVAQVRLLGYSSNRLLLTIENQNYGANVPIDTSQNGLWKMNTDGSGLTRLTAEDIGNESNLNLFTQYPWSNVSFDGSMYALQVTTMQSKDPITTLVFGELSGGKTTSFAFAHANAGTVEVAGWTLMPG
jgi:eukaryotic-like serine/threonine-protein kinase